MNAKANDPSPADQAAAEKGDKAPNLTKVELIKTHIHADIVRAVGEVLEVAENVADFLIGQGIAVKPGAKGKGKGKADGASDSDD